MGINNLCKLIDSLSPPSSKPTSFDSLLFDCQSFLYVAIEHSLETEEDKLFHEICESTWAQLSTLLNTFDDYACGSEKLTVVLSFDGEGVPMKWATQRERRKCKKTSQKAFYRFMLFGNNTLTIRVQNYLLEKLRLYNRTLTIILAGCNVPGEGEHKIFHLAESLPACRNPVVISVDQDVFILAFLRLRNYDTLQIYRYNRFYRVTRLEPLLPYPLKRFIDVSFLFGNDFIPVLVGISLNNLHQIHSALTFEEEREDVPGVLATFLQGMKGRIRFDTVEFVDRLLVVSFWMTYLWILDYYTRRHFPQQFLENRVYDAFDRNQLLTALTDEELSRSAFLEARETYGDMLTQPIPHAEQHIFTDQDLVDELKSYWIEPKNSLCHVLRLTSSGRTGGKWRRSPATGGGTPRKRGRIGKD